MNNYCSGCFWLVVYSFFLMKVVGNMCGVFVFMYFMGNVKILCVMVSFVVRLVYGFVCGIGVNVGCVLMSDLNFIV